MTKIAKWGLALVAIPLMTILMACIALYLPPVQQWAVDVAGRSASEATGMDISVERVRLAFPLDISVEGVKAVRHNDSLPQQWDTIAYVKRAVVDVQLLPLFQSRVCANAMELVGMKLNTVDFIPQARIKGEVGRLALEGGMPVADVDLGGYGVALRKAVLDGAHLDIALTDSVPEDTTVAENLWKISLGELSVNNSDILLHLPGDTLQVGMQVGSIIATGGNFDLHQGLYELARCKVGGSSVQYDNKSMRREPNGVLDANHLALSDINIGIDSLRFLSPELKVKVK